MCLGAVCAPEPQKDFSPTLQCTAPTSTSSVVTQKVIAQAHIEVLYLYISANLAKIHYTL